MKALLFKSKAALNIRYWARSLLVTVHSVCVKESKVIWTWWKPEKNENKKESTPHHAFCHPGWIAKWKQVVAANRFSITTVTLGCINPIISVTARLLTKFKRCIAREVIYWQNTEQTMFITAWKLSAVFGHCSSHKLSKCDYNRTSMQI